MKRRLKYFVVFHNDEWKVSFENKHYGPYATQEDAIAAAQVAAQSSADQGHNAQVLLQGDDQRFLPKWSYGEDSDPPIA